MGGCCIALDMMLNGYQISTIRIVYRLFTEYWFLESVLINRVLGAVILRIKKPLMKLLFFCFGIIVVYLVPGWHINLLKMWLFFALGMIGACYYLTLKSWVSKKFTISVVMVFIVFALIYYLLKAYDIVAASEAIQYYALDLVDILLVIMVML